MASEIGTPTDPKIPHIQMIRANVVSRIFLTNPVNLDREEIFFKLRRRADFVIAAPPGQRPMNLENKLAKPTTPIRSIHLDAFRAVAAFEVFAGHVRQQFLVDYGLVSAKGWGTRLLFFGSAFGRCAVMVFFVLSGYFISRAVIGRVKSTTWSWTSYLIQRGARLYAVLLPALILGAAWDAASVAYLPPGMSTIAEQIRTRMGIGTWLGNLFFLQGIVVETFGSNGPLWSLSYEFWYYLAFPCFVLAICGRGLLRRIAFALAGFGILVWVGRQIAEYFLVWLLGAGVALLPVQPTGRAKIFAAVGGAALAALLVRAASGVHDGFTLDLSIGVAFALLTWGLLGLPASTERIYGRVASDLAAGSYTLYLTHYPAVMFLSGVVLRGAQWQPTGAALVKTGLAALVILGYVRLVWFATEARTDDLRAFATRAIARLRGSSLPAARTAAGRDSRDVVREPTMNGAPSEPPDRLS